MANSGKNLTYLRAVNQGAVLKTILLSGPSTRLELAAALNLTTMSISNITSDLLEKGILTELSADARGSMPGRRSAQLALVPGALTAVGISVFRRRVRFTLADLSGQVLDSRDVRLAKPVAQSDLTNLLVENVQGILDRHPGDRILGIGISAIGIVDTRQGALCETTDFFGVRDWPIGNILYNRFSLPTYIVEDMKASALAESYYGVAKDYADFVYLGITHGIGIGVIHNGKLLEGHNGFSGEIGHVTLYRHGLPCPCGNTGCVEMYLSVPVILQRYGFSAWDEFLALCQEQPDSEPVTQFLDDLGSVLVTVSNLFDPQAIVIGHEGALLDAECFHKLQAVLNERAITRRIRKTAVHPSALAHRIADLNAPAVIFSRLFLGECKL